MRGIGLVEVQRCLVHAAIGTGLGEAALPVPGFTNPAGLLGPARQMVQCDQPASAGGFAPLGVICRQIDRFCAPLVSDQIILVCVGLRQPPRPRPVVSRAASSKLLLFRALIVRPGLQGGNGSGVPSSFTSTRPPRVQLRLRLREPFASRVADGSDHHQLPRRWALTLGVLPALFPARLRGAPAAVRPGA
jgi:hypothetical protein